MVETPAFLDTNRPDVPDIVVPRGIVPFFLPNRPVRGRLIRLGPLADALLSRHNHPPAVSRLAGQALALVAALASALKFRGSFSLQAKGDGPVSLLVADCTDQGALRFYARSDPAQLAALPDGETSAARLLGSGYLALTVDQGADMERHQGIVAIEGETLAQMAQHYFETSEQHDCRVHLACRQTDAGWRAAGLILERIAADGGIEGEAAAPPEETGGAEADEAWSTALTLAATISDDELLDDQLAAETLLYRLFHSEGVAADRPRALAYGCRCSRARLADILEGFAEDDLNHMVVDGDIVMTCEFCNIDFRFPRATIHGAG